MILQAAIDDSREGSIIVLAGHIATAESWAHFAKAWEEILPYSGLTDKHGKCYFKMSEMASGDDRRLKAGFFYRIIENHLNKMIAVAVDIRALRQVVCELGLPEPLENPYALIYRCILEATTQFQKQIGLNEPVDFFFDKDGQERKVKRGFEILRQNLATGGLLGHEPQFKNDEKFLPLQAADLIAWHLREHWLTHGAITGR